MRTLLVDNYDSFTFNLFQLIAEVNGEEPVVVRNDGATWEEIASWDVDNVVLSPGPGRPDRPGDFGVCADVLRRSELPLLGVCLGQQGLAAALGGRVVHAPEVMHGRSSAVYHSGSGLFAGLPQGFSAVRYHSLCVGSPVPDELEVIAWTDDGVIMGLAHRTRPLWGVQFHPESVCTSHGRGLLANFRSLTERAVRPRRAASRPPRSIVPHRRAVGRRGRAAGASPLSLLVERLEDAPGAEDVFLELHGGDPHAFWLDSARPGGEAGRFSFLGGGSGPLAAVVSYDAAAREVTVASAGERERRRETIFDYLRGELERMAVPAGGLPFDLPGGFVGYLGYELKADCGGSLAHRSAHPDAMLLRADRLIAFDHDEGCAYLVCLVDAGSAAAGERWLHETGERLARVPPVPLAPAVEAATDAPADGRRSSFEARLVRPRERYLADIARCRELLREGETYEVCLTNVALLDAPADPLLLYRILRRLNPAPFGAYLRFGGLAIASSSPERFLRIRPDGRVEAKPIKGTTPRGRTSAEDERLARSLRASEKDRAENLMITDLVRNDLGLVCEVGSVEVPSLFAVESYETVHQLVSTVRGRLRADLGPVDCIRACFPGGSMTGAPKRRTMEIIDELEGRARGVYSGAIGYLGLGGGADLSIAIRLAVVEAATVSIGAGGAIVAQSDAESEYREMLLKADVVARAVALAAEADAAELPPALASVPGS